MLEGLVSSGGFKRDSVPCFFLGTRGYPHSMTHGLIQHHFFYLVPLHSSFHFCYQISLCLFLRRTMMITLRDHQDNLGQSLHLKILNIYKAPLPYKLTHIPEIKICLLWDHCLSYCSNRLVF